mgnify:CR=1 FL=1
MPDAWLWLFSRDMSLLVMNISVKDPWLTELFGKIPYVDHRLKVVATLTMLIHWTIWNEGNKDIFEVLPLCRLSSSRRSEIG